MPSPLVPALAGCRAIRQPSVRCIHHCYHCRSPSQPWAWHGALRCQLLPLVHCRHLSCLFGCVINKGYGRIRNMGMFQVEPMPLCLPLHLAASCLTWTRCCNSEMGTYLSQQPEPGTASQGAVHHQCFWVLLLMNAGAYKCWALP